MEFTKKQQTALARSSRVTAKQADKAEAIETLRRLLPVGAVIYVIIRSVAGSGMSRTMDAYLITNEGETLLSGFIAKALDLSRTKDGALRVPGVGMNMVHWLAYETGRAIHGRDASVDALRGRQL